MDHYRLLGVDKNATTEEIRKAYRILAKKYHPDLNEDKNAEYLFIQIKEAYQTLSDKEKRRTYDEQMGFNHTYRDYSNEETEPSEEEPDYRSEENGNSSSESNEHNKDSNNSPNKPFPNRIYTGIAIAVVAVIAVAIFSFFTTPKVTGVKLNYDILYLETGEQVPPLTATLMPSRASKAELVWGTSNPKVVEVNSLGNIIAKDEGSAIITVEVKETGHKAQCQVVVTYKTVTNHSIRNGVYSGTLKNILPHGKGVMIYANGDKYEGEWIDGKQHGKGVMIYANGGKFEGEWIDGRYHGHGEMLYEDGTIYIGEWIGGRQQGPGKITLPNWVVYEGGFKNGRLHGSVVITAVDGKRLYFAYTNGHPAEKGVVVFPDGRTYNATYKNGSFHW